MNNIFDIPQMGGLNMAAVTVAETRDILAADLANLEVIRDNWFQIVARSKIDYDEAFAEYQQQKDIDFQFRYEASYNIFKRKEEQFSAICDRTQKVKDMLKLLAATEKHMDLQKPKDAKGN